MHVGKAVEGEGTREGLYIRWAFTLSPHSPCHLPILVCGEPGFYFDTQHFGCDGWPDGDGSEI